MSLPDLVYPVRPGQHDEPEWLRYSLRTIHHHLPHGRVFIVGHMPSFLDPEMVHHIPSEQLSPTFANRPEPSLRFHNQRLNLEAVMASDVGEDFIWMNDDFFILRDVESFPLYHRGSLSNYLHGLALGDYAEGLRFCLKLLESWGYDDPNNYAVHAPLPVSKTRLIDVMTRAWEDGMDGGFMRAIYPVGMEGAHVEISDPKMKLSGSLPELEWSVVSTSPSSWSGRVGELIRNRYWRPSPFER